ncbi:MAG: pyridoxamine 5'-phosphate oxidase family protein [Defluviitaleaceae bacterium]|nr:pyridoxamine 5'-phosphate oxidase family protein [Defluviitaleaceae bacterium]
MSEQILKRAGEVIAAKTDYVGGGMEGFVVLSVIDEDGFPSGSAITVSKSQGIEWVSMLTSMDSNKVLRLKANNKASLTFATPQYNIALVGTVEILTNPADRKPHWQEAFNEPHGTFDDPEYCALLFKTQRYSILFADDSAFTEGRL